MRLAVFGFVKCWPVACLNKARFCEKRKALAIRQLYIIIIVRRWHNRARQAVGHSFAPGVAIPTLPAILTRPGPRTPASAKGIGQSAPIPQPIEAGRRQAATDPGVPICPRLSAPTARVFPYSFLSFPPTPPAGGGISPRSGPLAPRMSYPTTPPGMPYPTFRVPSAGLGWCPRCCVFTFRFQPPTENVTFRFGRTLHSATPSPLGGRNVPIGMSSF